MWNLKNTTNQRIKQKEADSRYQEQTSGYQWGEGREKEPQRGEGGRGTNYQVQDRLQHGEYRQYFAISIKGN